MPQPDRIQINQYIQNQLSRAPALLQSYTQDSAGNKYLKRSMFIRLKKLVDDFSGGKKEIRIVCIPGLRGVGKTTLLAQLFLDLLGDHREGMLYLATDRIVNELNSDLNTVFDEYQRVLGVSFEKLDRDLFIFIDEIHFDKNWPAILKSIYDRSKNVFVLCTGSSALSMQSSPDLARRVLFEPLYPMNFSEYMLLKTQYLAASDKIVNPKFPVKGLKEGLKNALFLSPDADQCFGALKRQQSEVNKYWLGLDGLEVDSYLRFGTMPFALTIQDESKVLVLTNELIDKVVEKDFAELERFSADTISIVKNVLLMVAGSDEVSITNLAAVLKGISVNTLVDVFRALEKAEVLMRVYPYGSVYKKVRKPSKYYFMTPSLRYALLNLVEGEKAFEAYKGRYLEDIVVLYLHREFGRKLGTPILYDSSKGGADFILQIGGRKIAIEVGYGEKGIKQVEYTLKGIKGSYGLVISISGLELSGNIVKVPLEYFLLI